MDTLSRRELFKKYSYGLVNTNDIDELQNLFDYCSGLILKNDDLATKNETSTSARNSNIYIKACLKQDEYNETQRENLKVKYIESNKYYNWLLKTYNIDPLKSRLAEDFDILMSVNTTDDNGKSLLTEQQLDLFIKCYKEALFYWNNVTRTKSFKAEDMFREFSEVYLIFMAISRYITNRMKDQFNVDTFSKYQCKNYFISNGVDYFDMLPLNYQRRLIKLLNDLQRDKGDDKVFDYIKQVLMTNNINLYKYSLVKYNPTKDKPEGDLYFYKTPYNEELNTDINPNFTFEEITEDDPYWRASKNEILCQRFNSLDTKYISIEYIVNIIKNSKSLSYFMYLLNEAILDDANNNLKTSLRFFNKNITSKAIDLYDAMLAIFSLYYTYIKNDDFTGEPADKIDPEGDGDGYINNIHGYSNYKNDDETKRIINDIFNEIDEENSRFDTTESTLEWNNKLKNFLNNDFNLKDFYYSDNYTFETIAYYYKNPSYITYDNNSYQIVKLNGNIIKEEFLNLARYINAVEYYNHNKFISYKRAKETFDLYSNVLHDNLKESLEYLLDLIFSYSMPIAALNIYPNFKLLFKKYLAYLIINGELTSSTVINPRFVTYYNNDYDIFYNFIIGNRTTDHPDANPIYTDLVNYIFEVYGYDDYNLKKFISNYENEEGFKNFIKFIRTHQSTFFTNDSLLKYPNAYVFLELFASLKKEIFSKNLNDSQSITGLTDIENKKSDITISEFMDIYTKNESIRLQLETFIKEATNRDIYNSLRELWNHKFKSNFNYETYKGFDSFKEYLVANDEELYTYVTSFGEFNNDNDRRTEIENRLLELSSSIESYINSTDNIVYNSTFNIIFSDIKDYARLLIEVFKAYTLDTLYAKNIIEFNDSTNDYIKIFDGYNRDKSGRKPELEPDDIIEIGPDDDPTLIENLEFHTKNEYIDFQDDIRKENADLDVAYSLSVYNKVDGFLDPGVDEKYLKYCNVEFKLFKKEDNLPYGTTSLTPDQFNAIYENQTIPSKLGLSQKKFKYVKESYDFYHNNDKVSIKTVDSKMLSFCYFKSTIDNDDVYYHLQYLTTEDDIYTALTTDPDPDTQPEIYKLKQYLNQNNMYFIDTTLHKVYCKDNDNEFKNYWENTRDSRTGLYYLDYTSQDYDQTISGVLHRYIGYMTVDDTGISHSHIYNYSAGTFEDVFTIPTIYQFIGDIRPYVMTHDMDKETDTEVKIYYDPNVFGGYSSVVNGYIVDPLDNIFDNYPSSFNKYDVNYNNLYDYGNFNVLTKNKDFFVKYYNNTHRINKDTSRTTGFYIRPSRSYNSVIVNRIPYNKRIHPMLVPLVSEDYMTYLNDNNLVNKEYIYYLINEDNSYKYYIPTYDDITETYILTNDKTTNNIDDLKYILEGNSLENIELELNEAYSMYAQYTYESFFNVAKYIEKDTIANPANRIVNKELILYVNLGHEMTDNERQQIQSCINLTEDITSTGTTYKIVGDNTNKTNYYLELRETQDGQTYSEAALLNMVFDLFETVGCPISGSKGYSSGNPFTTLEDLIDEIYKYKMIFVSLTNKKFYKYIKNNSKYDVIGNYRDTENCDILYKPIYSDSSVIDSENRSILNNRSETNIVDGRSFKDYFSSIIYDGTDNNNDYLFHYKNNPSSTITMTLKPVDNISVNKLFIIQSSMDLRDSYFKFYTPATINNNAMELDIVLDKTV